MKSPRAEEWLPIERPEGVNGLEAMRSRNDIGWRRCYRRRPLKLRWRIERG